MCDNFRFVVTAIFTTCDLSNKIKGRGTLRCLLLKKTDRAGLRVCFDREQDTLPPMVFAWKEPLPWLLTFVIEQYGARASRL